MQVRPQPPHPGAVAADGEVRAEPERLGGDGFGQAADDPPAGREPGVGERPGEVGSPPENTAPGGERGGPPAPRRGTLPAQGDESAGAQGRGPPGRGAAGRLDVRRGRWGRLRRAVHGTPARGGHVADRRASTRAGRPVDGGDPLPDRPHRAGREQPQRHGQGERDAEPLEAGADQRRDQAFGALDETAVRGEPRALGARLDIRDHLPRDQADQRRDAERLLAADQAPPGDRGEQDAVRDAVADRVEHRPERRAEPAGPRHRAVDHVEQHEDGDQQRAEEQLAARDEHHRRGGGADGARDGDRVRGDAAGHQPAADRTGDPAEGRAEEVEHRSCSGGGSGVDRVQTSAETGRARPAAR